MSRPRIRTVKPELFLHEQLFDAEVEAGLPLRLAFIGLFCHCDREGRFRWRPRTLGAQVLPFDGIDFSRVLDALTTRGFVVRYESDGEVYGCIPTFTEHQAINCREGDSELPGPYDDGSEVVDIEGLVTRAPRVPHACTATHVHARAEGKGTGTGTGTERNFSPSGVQGEKSKPAKPSAEDAIAEVEPAEVQEALREWVAYKSERRQSYKPVGLRQLVGEVRNRTAEHGAEIVARAIRGSMADGYQGIAWAKYVEASQPATRGSPSPPKSRGEIATERFLAAYGGPDGDGSGNRLRGEHDLRLEGPAAERSDPGRLGRDAG